MKTTTTTKPETSRERIIRYVIDANRVDHAKRVREMLAYRNAKGRAYARFIAAVRSVYAIYEPTAKVVFEKGGHVSVQHADGDRSYISAVHCYVGADATVELVRDTTTMVYANSRTLTGGYVVRVHNPKGTGYACGLGLGHYEVPQAA